MSNLEDFEELVIRLQNAISQFEEAEEAVGEAGIEIEQGIERLQRASPVLTEEITDLINCLSYDNFKRPVNTQSAYAEVSELLRLLDFLRALEPPEPEDVAS